MTATTACARMSMCRIAALTLHLVELPQAGMRPNVTATG